MRKSGLSRPASKPQSFTLRRLLSGSRRDHREGAARPLGTRALAKRGLHEGLEERMPVARRGGELRVELHADEERMARQLHDLRQVLARRARRDLVALGL